MAFGFRSLHEQILTRKINFVNKFISCSNSICSATLANFAKKRVAHSAEPIRQLQLNKHCKRYMLTHTVTVVSCFSFFFIITIYCCIILMPLWRIKFHILIGHAHSVDGIR